MFYDDDLSIFFDEFAEPATVGTQTIKVIFDNIQMVTDSGFTQVIGYKPNIEVKNTDIASEGIVEDIEITVRGRVYTVASITDEGFGTSRIVLQST